MRLKRGWPAANAVTASVLALWITSVSVDAQLAELYRAEKLLVELKDSRNAVEEPLLQSRQSRLLAQGASPAAASESIGTSSTAAPVVPLCPPTTALLAPTEQLVLSELSAALNISGWPLRTVASACQSWKGVCCSASGAVQSMSTAAVRAQGYVPSSITQLTGLTRLDLVLASLNTILPEYISSMTQLKSLSFTGTMSNTTHFQDVGWAGSLTGLTSLSLSNTPLQGYIPEDLSALVALQQLDVSNTGLDLIPCWVSALQELRTLDAWNADVYGTLPAELALLPNLAHLHLAHNQFFGSIPARLLNSSGPLEHLDLTGNRIQGSIPASISLLSGLTALGLGNNTLSGTIPPELLSLPRLTELQLSDNNFSGPLPSTGWSLASSLQVLNVSNNQLNGSIPSTMALATSLRQVYLPQNNLTNSVPASLTNLPTLGLLWLDENQLSGPLDQFASNKGMLSLGLSFNNFNGSFPKAFAAMTQLTKLNISHNSISGPFPSELLGLGILERVDLTYNLLSGPLPPNIGMWPGNYLRLSRNNFSGDLPASLRNLTGLLKLDLSYNSFSGSPDWMDLLGGMQNITSVLLNSNRFNGSLPVIPGLSKLQELNLANNSFSGSIPMTMGSLQSLTGLYISGNRELDGSLPSTLSFLTSLRALYVGGNRITGPLPDFLADMNSLAFLSLEGNRFRGSIPLTLCRLTGLSYINLAQNELYGNLPSCLYLKEGIKVLDVSRNFLFGTLQNQLLPFNPETDGVLEVSNNFFYGAAPIFFNRSGVCKDEQGQLQSSTPFQNITFAGVPGMYYGHSTLGKNCFSRATQLCEVNELLETQRTPNECGAFCGTGATNQCAGLGTCQALPAPTNPLEIEFHCVCNNGFQETQLDDGTLTCEVIPPVQLSVGAIAGITVAAVLIVSAIIVAWILVDMRRKWLARQRWRDLEVCTQYSLARVEKATNSWSEENLLGEGAYGSVYKGQYGSSEEWAVKRAKLLTNEFEMEVKAMATLHHKNLVRLLGFCVDYNPATGIQEQILVYEFVSNGDLGKHLYDRKTTAPISLDARLQIAIGTAEGIAYLHSFEPPIIHRDVKPENILLDVNFEPKIADFGLLKRLDGVDAATRVAGTPGYVDPEYNKTRLVTTKTDVYSLGVVLLEMITGKRPLIRVHDDENMPKVHIVQWVKPRFEEWDGEALQDPVLVVPTDAILEIALVAVDCVRSPAMARPEMREVAHRLQAIREKYAGLLDNVMHVAPADTGDEENPNKEAGPDAPLMMVSAPGRRRNGDKGGLNVPEAVREDEELSERGALSARFDEMRDYTETGDGYHYAEEHESELSLRFDAMRENAHSGIEDTYEGRGK